MQRAVAIVGRLVSPYGLAKEEGGQDLIEYALLVGLITLVAVAAITSVGQTVNGVFWEAIAAVTL